MNLLKPSKLKATVVVGLDFGTTFSGFAYALTSRPDDCRLFYEWPAVAAAGASNYCKTQTSLLYSSGRTRDDTSSKSLDLQAWGHEARVQYAQGKESQHQKLKRRGGKRIVKMVRSKGNVEHFVTLFKLHLAGSVNTSAADLPHDLTLRRTISDYLRKLSELILTVLQNELGSHINMAQIQWCITVPAIWDNSAKQEMKTCAEVAGLVQGPHCKDVHASPHPVIIVLEPEAASFYCQEKANFPLDDGDKFLVVDAGGGTVDLALHQKTGPPWCKKVREVAPSCGALCGGTYVDERFFKFLRQKISCFRKVEDEDPQIVLELLSKWEPMKREFDGCMQFDHSLDLPVPLAQAWEASVDLSKSGHVKGGGSYDSIAVTLEDMLGIFDPVVDQILQLLDDHVTPDLKAVMIVGGFSASHYLRKRIEAAFAQKLSPGTIIFPKEPGSAICCGAVAYGMSDPDRIMSRISKKTYGISIARPFLLGDPLHLVVPYGNGFPVLCTKVFHVFARMGETVAVDACVSHKFSPISDDQTECRVSMFSTADPDPAYVTDPGVTAEGSFMVHLPRGHALRKSLEIRVSMYFGRTMIELKAEGENFGDDECFEMPPVTFEGAFERLSLRSS